jgi:hypothetical protein
MFLSGTIPRSTATTLAGMSTFRRMRLPRLSFLDRGSALPWRCPLPFALLMIDAWLYSSLAINANDQVNLFTTDE